MDIILSDRQALIAEARAWARKSPWEVEVPAFRLNGLLSRLADALEAVDDGALASAHSADDTQRRPS
jgi:hypothetical protein